MEYKGYLIEIGENTSSHVIRHTGKGSLPKVLSGEWNSVRVAVQAVDKYVDSKEQK